MKSITPARSLNRTRGFATARLLFWVGLAAWGIASWNIAGPLSDNMRSRINDLATIPGAGEIERDPTGVFYHVNNRGMARSIYPELAPPVYTQPCLECTKVSGEQMSMTNDFCVSGVRKTLPQLQFEIPCQTWAPLGETQKVLAFGIFLLPLLAFYVLRAILKRLPGNRLGSSLR